MKTQIKSTLLALLFLASFVSCERETAQPVQVWTLDISFLTYSESIPVSHIYDNIGANGVKVGITLDFESERLKCRIFKEGDKVVQFTGIWDGHAFGIQGNVMGICGGQQNVNVTYKLEQK